MESHSQESGGMGDARVKESRVCTRIVSTGLRDQTA